MTFSAVTLSKGEKKNKYGKIMRTNTVASNEFHKINMDCKKNEENKQTNKKNKLGTLIIATYIVVFQKNPFCREVMKTKVSSASGAKHTHTCTHLPCFTSNYIYLPERAKKKRSLRDKMGENEETMTPHNPQLISSHCHQRHSQHSTTQHNTT
jgi:hypothetical protein